MIRHEMLTDELYEHYLKLYCSYNDHLLKSIESEKLKTQYVNFTTTVMQNINISTHTFDNNANQVRFVTDVLCDGVNRRSKILAPVITEVLTDMILTIDELLFRKEYE